MDAGKKTFTDPNDFTGSDIEKIQAAVYAAQNNGGKVRIYNVVLSNLLDTSPAGFSCFAALKIGDSNPRWGGVTPLGDTFNIKVHNLVSRAQSGIMIAGSLTGSEISGVTNLNPAARAVDYRSGRENVQNVSFENIIDFR